MVQLISMLSLVAVKVISHILLPWKQEIKLKSLNYKSNTKYSIIGLVFSSMHKQQYVRIHSYTTLQVVTLINSHNKELSE